MVSLTYGDSRVVLLHRNEASIPEGGTEKEREEREESEDAHKCVGVLGASPGLISPPGGLQLPHRPRIIGVRVRVQSVFFRFSVRH